MHFLELFNFLEMHFLNSFAFTVTVKTELNV